MRNSPTISRSLEELYVRYHTSEGDALIDFCGTSATSRLRGRVGKVGNIQKEGIGLGIMFHSRDKGRQPALIGGRFSVATVEMLDNGSTYSLNNGVAILHINPPPNTILSF